MVGGQRGSPDISGQGESRAVACTETPLDLSKKLTCCLLSLQSIQFFLDKTLQPWLAAVACLQTLALDNRHFQELYQSLWKLCDGTIFGLAGLKAALSQPSSSTASIKYDLLERVSAFGDEAAVVMLPALIQGALQGVRRHFPALGSILTKTRSLGSTEDESARHDTTTTLREVALKTFYEPALSMTFRFSEQHRKKNINIAAIRARLELLQFSTTSLIGLHRSSSKRWKDALSETLRDTLKESTDKASAEVHACCLDCIRALWQLDPELVRQHLDDTLSAMLHSDAAEEIGTVRKSAQSLLDTILEALCRAQEVPFFLQRMSQHAIAEDVDMFGAASSLGAPWLNRTVQRVVEDHLPATQIVETLHVVVSMLETATGSATSGSSDATPNGKRAHSQSTSTEQAASAQNCFRLANPILASLNIPAAIAPECDPLFQRIVASLKTALSSQATSNGAVAGASPSSRKKPRRSSQQATQMQVSAEPLTSAVWCWYGLCAGRRRNLAYDQSLLPSASFDALDECWPALLDRCRTSDTDASGTLSIELARVILFYTELATEGMVTSRFTIQAAEVANYWQKSITSLLQRVSDKAAAAIDVSLWEMITHRWLLVIERAASTEVLVQLSQVFVDTLSSTASAGEMRRISVAMANNADFLEMQRWRAAVMDTYKSRLESGQLSALATPVHLPLSYLTPSLRDALEVQSIKAIINQDDMGEGSHGSDAVKSWLCRSLRQRASIPAKLGIDLRAMVLALAHSPSRSHCHAALFETTLGKCLAAGIYDHASLEELVQAISTSNFLKINAVKVFIATSTDVVKHLAIPGFDLDGLQSSHNLPRPSNTSSMVEYLQHARLTLQLSKLRGSDNGQVGDVASTCIQHLCSSAFIEGMMSMPTTGEEDWQNLCVSFLQLSETCLNLAENQEVSSIRAILTFITVAASRETTSLALDDSSISRAFAHLVSQLNGKSYDLVLSAVIKAVAALTDSDSSHHSEDSQIGSLLTYLGVALSHGPEGTLIITQRHFTSVLTLLNHVFHHASTSQSALRVVAAVRCVEMVSVHRAMVFRPVDAELALGLLTTIVAPSGTNDSAESDQLRSHTNTRKAAKDIFTSTLNTLSSLVRLRRDVIIPLVPQFGILLGRLMALFRRPLPNLSATQKERFVASMPLWALPDEGDTQKETSLGQSEARQLSRLLDTILARTPTTSTTAFMRPSEGEKHKKSTSSLSHAFAKHAIYVILAYIHALVSPGSYMETSVKRELTVLSSGSGGITALCGIVGGGEAERDWVLASEMLGEAGKGVFKEIWREYERGRYKGA